MKGWNTLGQVIDLPEPSRKLMKAIVTAPTTINNEPAKVGSVVEVDAATFENLSRKGRLKKAVEITGFAVEEIEKASDEERELMERLNEEEVRPLKQKERKK